MKINGVATFWAKICKDQYTMVEAVVSSDLSDKFLISHLTQKSLGILHESWPYSYNAEMSNGLQEINMYNVNLVKDKKDEVWPNPKWPKEFRDLCVEYEDILVDTLTPVSRLQCPPMVVHVKDGVKIPNNIPKVKPVPLHLKALADKELQALIDSKIVEKYDLPLDCISPAKWVSKPVDNPNPDSLRLVTDMRKLNDVVKRPRIYFPGTREVWQKVKPNSILANKLI